MCIYMAVFVQIIFELVTQTFSCHSFESFIYTYVFLLESLKYDPHLKSLTEPEIIFTF